MGLEAGGEGIRFTRNANLAAQRAFVNPANQLSQILLCFVIAGETVVEADARRDIPPLKPDQYNRFDSVTSTDHNYVTIYDSKK